MIYDLYATLTSVCFCINAKEIIFFIFELNANEIIATEFGNIISALKNIFASHFINSRMEFNRQQTNVVAHAYRGSHIINQSQHLFLIDVCYLNNRLFDNF